MGLATHKAIIAAGLKSAVELAVGLTVQAFPFTPTQLAKIFEALPCIVVDDDTASEDRWDGTSQRQSYATYLLTELFCDLDSTDLGLSSDTLIHDMKEAAEAYLVEALPELEVRAAAIEASKVEGLPVQSQETGIQMRYAWFRLRLDIHP